MAHLINHNAVEEFRSSQSSLRLEELADLLGETRSEDATAALIERLGSDRVQEDADVENALCEALVKHGVMKKLGNLNYRFIEFSSQPASAIANIARNVQTIPLKYGPVPVST